MPRPSKMLTVQDLTDALFTLQWEYYHAIEELTAAPGDQPERRSLRTRLEFCEDLQKTLHESNK